MALSSTSTDVSASGAYQILFSDKIGRYMVANKDLEAGEEILTEKPFIVGPKASTYPLCLSCYTPWPPCASDDTPLCSNCQWPICNKDCENFYQHKDYECPVFHDAKETFNIKDALKGENVNGIAQLECITPLRLLLASEKFPERWEKEVKCMEAHNEKRKQDAQWQSDYINIVKFIRERLKLERFPEEAIQTACGILAINCHEVRTTTGYEATALYPTVALMNHSCVSNTCHSVYTDDYRIQLRTTVKVSNGMELFGSYTHSLFPTLIRRERLSMGKYFNCACLRCSDPTELGTHMSSIKCNKCDNGVLLPLDSLDPESQWNCTHCEFSTSGSAVRKLFQIINAEIDEVEALTVTDGPDSIHQRENVMKKYRSVLHPRHAYLTILRHSLSQLYGRVEEYFLDDLPDIILEHKIDICNSLLQVLDIVAPGMSRIRGMTLYELHAPLLFLAKSQWNAGVIDDVRLKLKMTEVGNILKEASMILCLEPPDSSEALLGLNTKEALSQLEQSIKQL